MIWTIAKKEWRTLLRSPLTWLALAVMQLIFAWQFLVTLEHWLLVQNNAEVRGSGLGVTAWLIVRCFSPASTLLLAITPLLTMRCIAEECQSTGIELLLSSPISASDIVLGKFIAAFGLYALLILLLGAMPLSLQIVTAVDAVALLIALLGLLLLGAASCAVGVYFSSLSNQAAVAALGAFSTLFFLWVIGADSSAYSGDASVTAYLSIVRHLASFLDGTLNSVDVVYYLLLCGLFIALSIRQIDHLRVQPS